MRKNSEDKFCSRSLRLNNNFLTELSGLCETVKHYFSEPALLSWLDLSFNDISHINAVSLRRHGVGLYSPYHNRVTTNSHQPSTLCSVYVFSMIKSVNYRMKLSLRSSVSFQSCGCCISMVTASVTFQRWTN